MKTGHSALCSDPLPDQRDPINMCQTIARCPQLKELPSRQPCSLRRGRLRNSSHCSRNLHTQTPRPPRRHPRPPAGRRPLRADGSRAAALLPPPRASQCHIRHSRSTSSRNWLTSWPTPLSRIFDGSQSSRMTPRTPKPTHPSHEPAPARPTSHVVCQARRPVTSLEQPR
jgi:hypothetical protein